MNISEILYLLYTCLFYFFFDILSVHRYNTIFLSILWLKEWTFFFLLITKKSGFETLDPLTRIKGKTEKKKKVKRENENLRRKKEKTRIWKKKNEKKRTLYHFQIFDSLVNCCIGKAGKLYR